MNLITEHGVDYFNARIAGAYFQHPDGWTGIVKRAGSAGLVEAVKIDGYIGKLRTTTEMLPYDYFAGLHVLEVPELGWRTAQGGRVMCYTNVGQSYMRGINSSNLNLIFSEMTYSMFENRAASSTYYTRADVRAKMITSPEYVSFLEGIEQLKSGEIASFAVSPVLAVSASDDSTKAVLYVRTRQVGTVDLESGIINCTVPSITQALGVAA